MARGPLPSGSGGSGGIGQGVLQFLEMMLLTMPPGARYALAMHVQAWVDRVRDEALAQMGRPPPGPNDFAAHGATHTTSGYERDF
jgi:hypothetical protein